MLGVHALLFKCSSLVSRLESAMVTYKGRNAIFLICVSSVGAWRTVCAKKMSLGAEEGRSPAGLRSGKRRSSTSSIGF
jgi:hypothetical protein